MIPVFEPDLGEAEMAAVADALGRRSISGTVPGDYLDEFETLVSRHCGVRHGVTTTSGTTALALAVAALGIGKGDEVLVPALTNIATAFAVVYAGATPVFLDSEPGTGTLDPALVRARITPRTRAIIPVHLYGHPVDMDPIMAIAAESGLTVIEDNAEAQGAQYRGKNTGGIGHIGCLSFYVNKTITTGEGGMLVTSDDGIAGRARSLKNLGYSSTDKFLHAEVGFNYRMTNLQAAMGVAQMRRLDEILAAKRRVAGLYADRLAGVAELQRPVEREWAKSTCWMNWIVLADGMPDCTRVRERLHDDGIETRAFFHPLHRQPVFLEMGVGSGEGTLPVAERLGRRGLYLPSSPSLSADAVDHVCDRLIGALS